MFRQSVSLSVWYLTICTFHRQRQRTLRLALDNDQHSWQIHDMAQLTFKITLKLWFNYTYVNTLKTIFKTLCRMINLLVKLWKCCHVINYQFISITWLISLQIWVSWLLCVVVSCACALRSVNSDSINRYNLIIF